MIVIGKDRLLKVFLTIIWLFLIHPCYGMQSYEKLWTTTIMTGQFSDRHPQLQYYLQSDFRLINDSYLFNQLLLFGGLGYQLNPRIAFFMGPAWTVDKSPNGDVNHEERLWEQFNWLMMDTPAYNINSRTRMEEIKMLNQPQVAYRFRERLWLRIPFKHSASYSFSCFDETFFNFNHPSWTSPYFFSQNRLFLGIGKQLSKNTILDIGYLNQYIHSTQNQLNNVLLFTLTIS